MKIKCDISKTYENAKKEHIHFHLYILYLIFSYLFITPYFLEYAKFLVAKYKLFKFFIF